MKIAAILGSAKGWETEYNQARTLLGRDFDSVYCVKRTGIVYDGGHFIWAGLHPEFMDVYEAERAAKGLHHDYEIVAPLECEVGGHAGKGKINRRVTYRYSGMTSSAGSGAYAAKVALDDGNDKAILVGCPMEVSRGHFSRGAWVGDVLHANNPSQPSNPDSFKVGFEIYMVHWRGRVRSMSGWTKEKLGGPSPKWLGVIPSASIGESPGVMPG